VKLLAHWDGWSHKAIVPKAGHRRPLNANDYNSDRANTGSVEGDDK